MVSERFRNGQTRPVASAFAQSVLPFAAARPDMAMFSYDTLRNCGTHRACDLFQDRIGCEAMSGFHLVEDGPIVVIGRAADTAGIDDHPATGELDGARDMAVSAKHQGLINPIGEHGDIARRLQRYMALPRHLLHPVETVVIGRRMAEKDLIAMDEAGR